MAKSLTQPKSEPLAYLHGCNDLIQGLENALEGRSLGDKVTVTLQPEDAFGDYDPELVEEMPLDAFPEGAQLEEGDEVTVVDEEGRKAPVTLPASMATLCT